MFQSTDVLKLQEGERIEAIIRQHSFTLWPKLLLSGLLIALPFFFLFALLGIGPFGVILLVLTIASGIFFALKSIIKWDAKLLLFTNKRLIHVDQRGVWSRRVYEIPLYDIQSIECERDGWRDWICRTATVTIASSGSVPQIQFPSLPKHKKFLERLNQMKESGVRRPTLNDIG